MLKIMPTSVLLLPISCIILRGNQKRKTHTIIINAASKQSGLSYFFFSSVISFALFFFSLYTYMFAALRLLRLIPTQPSPGIMMPHR